MPHPIDVYICVFSLSPIISKWSTAVTILLKHINSTKYFLRDKGEFTELEPIFYNANMARYFRFFIRSS